MSDWNKFLTKANFELAWERILRSRHFHNKDRIGLRIYEANLEANLTNLLDVLREEVYEPTQAEMIYLPKRPGTLRTIPFLNIEDRLVYQAIVNVIADNSRYQFETYVQNNVFAHLLSGPTDFFFTRKWDGANGQYRLFLNKVKELWNINNTWIVQADIASYYDSVDHNYLIQILKSEQWLKDEQISNLLGRCLLTWTRHEDGGSFPRGLPQGYEASDYLATIFLLPVDRYMTKHWNYVRYVDDIRILAPDRITSSKALSELDLKLKKQALILQPAKIGARKVTDIDQELDKMRTTLSMIDQNRRLGEDVDEEAEELFLKSWEALELEEDIAKEGHLIFALNRVSANDTIKLVAIELLQKMPWRSSNITSYLSEFKDDNQVINALLGEFRNNSFLHSWHAANCIQALAKISDEECYRDLCYDFIEKTNEIWYIRLAAVESLQNDRKSHYFFLYYYKEEKNYLVRRALLIAAAHAATTNEQIANVIRTGVKDTNPQIIATAVWLFLEYPNCGISIDEFGVEVGIHRKMIPAFLDTVSEPICFIKTTLSTNFKVKMLIGFDFRHVLGSSYDEARYQLYRAFRFYSTDPVTFVSSMNNFNKILAIKILESFTLKGNSAPDYSLILEDLMGYFPILGAPFLLCNRLEEKIRSSSPRVKSLGNWTEQITHQKKDALIKDLQVSYQNFHEIFIEYENYKEAILIMDELNEISTERNKLRSTFNKLIDNNLNWQQTLKENNLQIFIEKLLECKVLRIKRMRSIIVSNLPSEIRDNIEEDDIPKYHTYHIVSTCLRYPKGVTHLLRAINLFEEGTKAWSEVILYISSLIG